MDPRPRAGELVSPLPVPPTLRPPRHIEPFARHVLASIEVRGITQAELAYLAGINEDHLRAYLRGAASGRRLPAALIPIVREPVGDPC